MVQDRAMANRAIRGLSNGAILNDLDGPPNPDFKVRPFFDAEYLQNGCRYGHSYYGRRLGNRTQAFEWHIVTMAVSKAWVRFPSRLP